MSQQIRCIITGGGTGGHVLPNIALIEELLKENKFEILYIGERGGQEEELIKGICPFKGILCGKFRRYFSFKNLIDIIKFLFGFIQSLFIIIKFNPQIIFGKGGYVSLPVGLAAIFLKKKLIIHESDLSPGLSTKILSLGAKKILLSWAESLKFFNKKLKKKCEITGNLIRKEITQGEISKALKFCGWKKNNLPTILIMGGSSGAAIINELVEKNLEELLKFSRIIHITGIDKGKKSIEKISNYKQIEYVGKELKDLYKLADLVISRAGAGAISEIIANKKVNILIPLSKQVSRGDQILNANMLEKYGATVVLNDNVNFLIMVKKILKNPQIRKKEILAMEKLSKLIIKGREKTIKIIYDQIKDWN